MTQAPGVTVKPQAPGVTVIPHCFTPTTWKGSFQNRPCFMQPSSHYRNVNKAGTEIQSCFWLSLVCLAYFVTAQSRLHGNIWKCLLKPAQKISVCQLYRCALGSLLDFFIFFQERSGNITMRKSSMPHHTSARANSHNTNSVLAKIPELDTNNKSKMIPERFQWARLLTPWCIHPQKTTPVFRQQEEEIRIKHLQSRGLF